MYTGIRLMNESDADTIIDMMRTFYASPAVHTNGSEKIFRNDVQACVSDNPYLEGYVFDSPEGLRGYAMVAKSYSTEFGAPCIWVEDLYIEPAYRGMGLGSAFLRYISEQYPNAILRLEVEEENERAVHVYRKAGFDVLPYMEMKKDQLSE